MNTAGGLVAQCRAWLGTPWLHQGRTRSGVDCVGLILAAAAELGIKRAASLELADYGRQTNDDRLRRLCEEHLAPWPLHDLRPGLVALMRFDVHPQHVGVLGDYPHGGGARQLSLIHAHQQQGRVVEHRLADVWRARLVAVYAVPELSYE
jgi:cell wall-associated NlpC family hydrolase